jgi:hypothetical protein
MDVKDSKSLVGAKMVKLVSDADCVDDDRARGRSPRCEPPNRRVNPPTIRFLIQLLAEGLQLSAWLSL